MSTSRDSFQNLINSEKPVFIDFHAEWCGPCKSMNPIIKEMSRKIGDRIRVIKIDIDKNNELANRLAIRGVPTFALYQKGQLLWRQSGMMTLEMLMSTINSRIESK